MTQQEFVDSVTTWDELIEFCGDYGLTSYIEDIVCESDLDGHICEDIRDVMYDHSWQRIRDWLYDIDDGYDWFRQNGAFDYDGLEDEDLDELKNSIIEDVDEDFWDAEESDEPEEPEVSDFDLDAVDLDNGYAAMAGDLESVRQQSEEKEREESAKREAYILRLMEEEARKAEEQRQYEQERKDLFMDFMTAVTAEEATLWI